MNTFAVLLLAFPFYLAINSRLTAYTTLVNKNPSTGAAASSQPVNSVTPIAPIA